MEKYARINDFNGKGMNEGFCFNDGEYYCETELQAKKYVESLGLSWEEETLKFDTENEWFYWTDWYDTETDVYYDINGVELKVNKETIFAVYKKGIHLGNVWAENSNAAIRKYLIAALYEGSLNDKEFVSLYSVKKAIKGIHFV